MSSRMLHWPDGQGLASAHNERHVCSGDAGHHSGAAITSCVGGAGTDEHMIRQAPPSEHSPLQNRSLCAHSASPVHLAPGAASCARKTGSLVALQSSARTQRDAPLSHIAPAVQKYPETHISTAARTRTQSVSHGGGAARGGGGARRRGEAHALHAIASSSPQMGGHAEPQSLCTWPPQSRPMLQALAGGSTGSEAQHSGSGAKQRAPSGQQPEHSS